MPRKYRTLCRLMRLDDDGAEMGQVRVIPDLQACPGLANAELYAELNVRSLASVTILHQEQPVGRLNVLVLGQVRCFSAADLRLLQDLADQATQAIANAQLSAQLRQQRLLLHTITIRLAETEENERCRLARELHDCVGQNLTALGIGLDVIRSRLPPEALDNVKPWLADCQQLVRELAGSIRDVMGELRPPVLDDYGLLAALHWYGEQFALRTQLRTAVSGEYLGERLPLSVEMALFRIAQEALTNVAKHAQAHQVTVSLESLPTAFRMTIADDGVGFVPPSSWCPGVPKGWGLLSMRERARAVNGVFRVESAPGRGTRIIVDVARS